ncbi:unnamed protein product [Orchesella dallaii]|uniref:Lipase domain-containing protein n=1 Tax=Orchesella dallaii TaxID=48710 RepID=A0ABP1QB51_9HEXA
MATTKGYRCKPVTVIIVRAPGFLVVFLVLALIFTHNFSCIHCQRFLPDLPNIFGLDLVSRVSPAIEELELDSMLPALPFYDKDVNNVGFYLYTADSDSSEAGYSEDYLAVNDPASVKRSSFKSNNQVKILIHGWSQKIKSRDFPGPVKHAYLEVASSGNNSVEHNVICVDWSSMSREFLYVNSVMYAEKVGRRVGEFIVFLKLGGFIQSYKQIHIIGFSLGAQVAGIAGYFVSQANEGKEKVGRITGLDPAGPMFSSESVPLNVRLDSSDAEFVDVIHTNMGLFLRGEFGTPLPTGHADFYPNGGHRQPSCDLAIIRQYSLPRKSGCHHMKSIDYFTDSILGVHYYGCKCPEWNRFRNGLCDCQVDENMVLMGENIDHESRGRFFLYVS